MLNYEIDHSVLLPYVPRGTEIERFNNKIIISVVGFLFVNTKVFGLSMPFHRNFEEVNLRFYVRRRDRSGWRSGVVFIKELAPKIAVAWVARALYGENYQTVSMNHQITYDQSNPDRVESISYNWKCKTDLNQLHLQTIGDLKPATAGSEEEFITEHYWGYSAQKNGTTLEYFVEHQKWNVWQAKSASLECDVRAIYGDQFVEPLTATPSSAFLADGSQVKVSMGRVLDQPRP